MTACGLLKASSDSGADLVSSGSGKWQRMKQAFNLVVAGGGPEGDDSESDLGSKVCLSLSVLGDTVSNYFGLVNAFRGLGVENDVLVFHEHRLPRMVRSQVLTLLLILALRTPIRVTLRCRYGW